MPERQFAARRSIASRMNQVLSEFGLENSVSGGKYDDLRQTIDPQTGYWAERSVPSKPPRLIVHLDPGDPATATTPPANANGTFAYANTARRSVGGIVSRVLPVIKLSTDDYFPYPDWEWLLWYCFWPRLANGSSGQVFDGFDPASGTFTYMGQNQPYIAAGLVTLNEPQDMCVHPQDGNQLTYAQATDAIRTLIQVNRPSAQPVA